jgi:hypothetical protein
MSVELFGDLNWPQAIVIRKDEKVIGIEFFSPDDFPQQIGLMGRAKGFRVLPHFHNRIERKIQLTQEVLIVRKGSCKVSLYDHLENINAEIILFEGDVILLAHGGHALETLEYTEILEVKQGPYSAQNDKKHF